MPTACTTTIFSANETDFPGTPLVLDQWMSLAEVNLASVVATLYSFDIPVIGGEGGGVVGGEGGGVVGPQ